jgi:hypothetical protein
MTKSYDARDDDGGGGAPACGSGPISGCYIGPAR